jgi:hypothetical protein
MYQELILGKQKKKFLATNKRFNRTGSIDIRLHNELLKKPIRNKKAAK